MQSKIDPTLADLLDRATASKTPVQVVVALKPGAGESVASPDATEAQAHQLIERVTKETGESPRRYNVFRNLSSLAIEATPAFIRSLVEKDEVHSAIANQQGSSAASAPATSSSPIQKPVSGASKAPASVRRIKPKRK